MEMLSLIASTRSPVQKILGPGNETRLRETKYTAARRLSATPARPQGVFLMSIPIDRRRFFAQAAAGAGVMAAGCLPAGMGPVEPPEKATWQKPDYQGPEPAPGPFPLDKPNVILVRFGGGVRRLETIDHPDKTYCPFILHELAGKHGVLFNNVEMASAPKVITSHGQGTLYLLTGEYRAYKDITEKFLAERFEAPLPTLPEYLRKRYTDVQEHQALIVNGEDRPNEEFYTFSNHHNFGLNYRSSVLSLYGFKSYLLRKQLESRNLSDKDRVEKEKNLEKMKSQDYRAEAVRNVVNPKLEDFWARWRAHYGDSGFVNPRGDRLLTSLTLKAMKELRPRFMMVNYQDPDYVHWGPPHFYTRAVAIIDEGVKEIWNAVQADDYYRDNTVFVVVPDCGRDNNRCTAVPFQHHFGSKSSHEIFAVVAGSKKIFRGGRKPVDRLQQQISVAATVGELMGFRATEADAESLLKVI
jgi:hypothetical protein